MYQPYLREPRSKGQKEGAKRLTSAISAEKKKLSPPLESSRVFIKGPTRSWCYWIVLDYWPGYWAEVEFGRDEIATYDDSHLADLVQCRVEMAVISIKELQKQSAA